MILKHCFIKNKNNQKMIKTIVNNKNKIVKEVFKSNSTKKSL